MESFAAYDHQAKWVLGVAFYREGNGGSEMLSNLPRTTQLPSGKPGLDPRFVRGRVLVPLREAQPAGVRKSCSPPGRAPCLVAEPTCSLLIGVPVLAEG